jgi:hypothetical protein
MFRKYARKVASVLGVAMALALFLPKLVLADEDDPPSVVARLAFSQGSVSFQPAGIEDWVDAGINRPITTGDKLWSDQDGRVELQLDASTIRLFHSTGFSFLNLNDNVTQVRLSEGTILVRVRHLDRDETYEVDTPNLAFSITRPGIYRINVDQGGDATSIRVRDGEGQVTGGGASYSVRAHDDAVFSGVDQLNADVQDLSADYDEFDTWSSNRDRRWEHSRSAQYVSQDVVGYEDLDDHGDWRDTPEYGHVWYPRVEVADWAPYHYGHWAYIEPWGYTWVDDQPWGFAPFHYGRWVNVGGRWGWIPSPPRTEGVVYVRPVYAPALVAFVGGGGFSVGVSVGGGGGSVGWFALGPREVYVPSYRTSPRYVENVNISNTTVNRTVVNNYYQTTVVRNNTTVNNVTYVNQRVPGAVVATSQQAFTSAQSVGRNAVRVDERQLARAQVQVRPPTIVPTKQAVLGSARPAEHQPPPALQQRAVVAKAPPPPPPPSFERRQEAIKSNGGKPLTVTQIRQIQPAPAAQQVAAVRVAPPPRQAPVSVREAPKPAQPVNRTAAQGGQGAVGSRPVQQQPGQGQPGQPQNNSANRPGTPNNQQPGQPVNRPAERGTTAQPSAIQPNNRPADRPGAQPNTTPPNNRPADRPGAPPNASQPNERPNAQPATRPGDRPGDRPVTQPNGAQPQPNNSRSPATNDRPSSAQPNNRPADRPADRPVTRPNEPPPAARPNEQPAARPAPTERPADRPVTRPNEPPPNRPADRPADRPATRPNEQPAARPAPAERPADRPVTRPNEPPPNRPADRPADRPATRPNEQPTARPAPAERPADRPVTRPNEPPPNRPADRPAERPATRPNEQPAARPAPAERPAPRNEQPAARPAPAPAQRPAERPAERPAPPPPAAQKQQPPPQKQPPPDNKSKDKEKDKPPSR